jgi:hypothetical protein
MAAVPSMLFALETEALRREFFTPLTDRAAQYWLKHVRRPRAPVADPTCDRTCLLGSGVREVAHLQGCDVVTLVPCTAYAAFVQFANRAAGSLKACSSTLKCCGSKVLCHAETVHVVAWRW